MKKMSEETRAAIIVELEQNVFEAERDLADLIDEQRAALDGARQRVMTARARRDEFVKLAPHSH